MRNKEDWGILYALATNEGMKKKDARYEQAYDNIVNLFYEKDKQIDLMADFMYKTGTGRRALSCVFRQNDECSENGCNYCIKQYFAGLVEKGQ